MRLIDADELKTHVLKIGGKPWSEWDTAGVLNAIAYISTIDPSKRGHWIDFPVEDHIVCSACGQEWNTLDNDTHRFIYCPHCGANMKDDEASDA